MIPKPSSWVLFHFATLICFSSVFPSLCPLCPSGEGSLGVRPPGCFPRSVHKVAGQALGFGPPRVRAAHSPERPAVRRRGEGPQDSARFGGAWRRLWGSR